MEFEIVDSQLHVWDLNQPPFPWDPKYNLDTIPLEEKTLRNAVVHYNETEPNTPARALEAMASGGVSASILVNPSLYGNDMRLALKAAADFPGKFGVIGVLNSSAPDIEEEVHKWKSTPGALGLRIMALDAPAKERFERGVHDGLLAAANRYQVPLCFFVPGQFDLIASIARRFPDQQIILDHLGLSQPPMCVPDDPPFLRLPELVQLARYPNVALKLTSVPALSQRPYPCPDVWPHLHKLIEAYGLKRLMWGTDWTRVRDSIGYLDGIRYMSETRELSRSEKAALMSGTAREIFNWQGGAGLAEL